MRTFLIALGTSAVMSAVTAGIIFAVVDESPEPVVVPAAAVEESAQSARSVSARVTDEAATGEADLGQAEQARADGSLADEETAAVVLREDRFEPGELFEAAAHSVVTVMTDFGAGSGFFVDEEGHVVTNLHVVEDSGWIRVVTYAGESAAAELAGSDWGNDLAVLLVDPEGLTFEAAVLGDDSELVIGDAVAAIGAPESHRHSLSVGVISGLDRSRERDGRVSRNLIQSDAAINPGNSGGVLLNAEGEVIGVTTLIDSPVRGFTGIGLSVSADTLRRVLPRMIEGEEISHPRLGVAVGEEEDGLVVAQVEEDSAADEAGLEEDDLLVALEGLEIDGFAGLVAALEGLRVGETATITVLRDGEEVELEVELRPWERQSPEEEPPLQRFFFR